MAARRAGAPGAITLAVVCVALIVRAVICRGGEEKPSRTGVARGRGRTGALLLTLFLCLIAAGGGWAASHAAIAVSEAHPSPEAALYTAVADLSRLAPEIICPPESTRLGNAVLACEQMDAHYRAVEQQLREANGDVILSALVAPAVAYIGGAGALLAFVGALLQVLAHTRRFGGGHLTDVQEPMDFAGKQLVLMSAVLVLFGAIFTFATVI